MVVVARSQGMSGIVHWQSVEQPLSCRLVDWKGSVFGPDLFLSDRRHWTMLETACDDIRVAKHACSATPSCLCLANRAYHPSLHLSLASHVDEHWGSDHGESIRMVYKTWFWHFENSIWTSLHLLYILVSHLLHSRPVRLQFFFPTLHLQYQSF